MQHAAMMPARAAERARGAALEGERAYLFGLCYRMTGTSADAEELVQETFLRALSHPPERPADRPWLTRVAMNLARDHLRRRRRRGYVGPWLPGPVPDDAMRHEAFASAVGAAVGSAASSAVSSTMGTTPERRYELRESATIAFLLALEALTPLQRAVLILRDVLGWSGAEAAELLERSEGNVKVSLHRARKAMAAYDRERCTPDAALAARTHEAIARLMQAIVEEDVAALTELLREDVVSLSDGGGEFHAALRPILGRDRVIRSLRGLLKKLGPPERAALVSVNGLPAVLATAPAPAGWAERYLMRIELDAQGKVRAIHTVVATAKLRALPDGVRSAG